MIPPLEHLRAYLDAAFPGLFNASLAGLLFVALWGVRRWKPLFFAKLPPSLQAWPALASGAVLATLSTNVSGTLGTSIVNALGMSLTGLLSGVMASGIHRTLKESALPYGTDQIPPKKDPAPLVPPTITRISRLMVFLLALTLVTSCTKQAARSVVDDATLACTLLKSLDPTIGDVCATEAELAPIVKHLLAARRVRKMGAAPGFGANLAPVDACTVPLEVKP